MKKYSVLLLLFSLPLLMMAQGNKFFIEFTDKNNSPYNISTPQDFLSSKAIQRRINQQIPVTVQDLPVNPAYLDGVRQSGATILYSSRWLNGVSLQCDSSTLQTILALPYVRNAGIVKRAHAAEKPASKLMENLDPVLRSGSNLRVMNFDYGPSLNQLQLMNGEHLHNAGFTGSGMEIAVLDAGFKNVNTLPVFDSLRLNGRILGTWDFVSGNSSVYEDDAHGMQVLSCISGLAPGQLVGTAPHASVWLLRTEDAPTEFLIEEYNWIAGAEFADSAGASVLTSSLGYSTFDDPSMDHSYADMDGNTTPVSIGADIAASKGMLVLISAGNLGNSSWHYISAPADADSVLAVGAVTAAGWKASFSSFGPSSDGDIKPNVAAQGQSTVIAYQDGSFGMGSGTSFACPVLAGAAACLWQAHPDKSNMEVMKAIEKSASYYATPGDSLGYGIPDFRVADLLLGGLLPLQPQADALLHLFPNPFVDRVEMDYYSVKGEQIRVEITDILGRKVAEKSFSVQPSGINRITVPVPREAGKGIYLLQVQSSSKTFLKKLLKN